MGNKRARIVSTRLGRIPISPERIVRFPRGLIGFERMREFALLEIRPDSPFLLLQSLEEPALGFLVANPYLFVDGYQVKFGTAEQGVLKATSLRDLIVLVTVSVPPGQPERTTLNLTGPIVLNTFTRLGLQVPQVDQHLPGHFVLGEQLGDQDQRSRSSSSSF